MSRGGVVPITRSCARCNGPIPPYRHRSARYCKDACRIDAARARRCGLPRAIPPSTQARRAPAKVGALAPLLLLVGLLAGIALAFGYGQFMAEETPTAALEDQVVKLRKQIEAPLLNMAASDRAGRTPRQWVWCQHAGATIAPQWR